MDAGDRSACRVFLAFGPDTKIIRVYTSRLHGVYEAALVLLLLNISPTAGGPSGTPEERKYTGRASVSRPEPRTATPARPLRPSSKLKRSSSQSERQASASRPILLPSPLKMGVCRYPSGPADAPRKMASIRLKGPPFIQSQTQKASEVPDVQRFDYLDLNDLTRSCSEEMRRMRPGGRLIGRRARRASAARVRATATVAGLSLRSGESARA